jgi:hypothetical protein
MATRKRTKTAPRAEMHAEERIERVETAAPRRAARRGKCHVCGGEVAPFSTEELCWVCRRLKISAWRDSDTQAAAQE